MAFIRVAMFRVASVFALASPSMAATELTDSDREYLKTILPSQSPRSLRDVTPAEASCPHELIKRRRDDDERSRELSAFVGWIVLSQVSGDRTPPETCPPE
jgi:hypothetical protein